MKTLQLAKMIAGYDMQSQQSVNLSAGTEFAILKEKHYFARDLIEIGGKAYSVLSTSLRLATK